MAISRRGSSQDSACKLHYVRSHGFAPIILVLALGPLQNRGNLFQETVVADEADDVTDIRLLLQMLIEPDLRETGSGLHQDQGLGVSLPQLLDQPFK